MPPAGGRKGNAVIYGRRFGYILRKGVRLMRITFHIGAYTVTIVVKRRNRHPAR